MNILEKNIDKEIKVNDFTSWPDSSGHFGRYGGCYVPEILTQNLLPN
jgi:hypothetical protein